MTLVGVAALAACGAAVLAVTLDRGNGARAEERAESSRSTPSPATDARSVARDPGVALPYYRILHATPPIDPPVEGLPIIGSSSMSHKLPAMPLLRSPGGATASLPPAPFGKATLLLHSLYEMHSHYEVEFVKSPGFGMSRMPIVESLEGVVVQHAAQPYRLTDVELMGIGGPGSGMSPASEWRRIQVAAADEEGGGFKAVEVAYEGDLSAQDVDAIHDLLVGSEVVFVRDAGGTRAFGALRAMAACADCHQVEVGNTLGALVYRLEPAAVGDGAKLLSDLAGEAGAAPTSPRSRPASGL